jgi:hypothetical protein
VAGITRICFGTACIVAPRASARPWVGPGADSAGAQLLTRGMGIRDLLLGAGLLQALNHADHRAAARWLSYGAAAGVIDAGATLAAYPSLPRGGRVPALHHRRSRNRRAARSATRPSGQHWTQGAVRDLARGYARTRHSRPESYPPKAHVECLMNIYRLLVGAVLNLAVQP